MIDNRWYLWFLTTKNSILLSCLKIIAIALLLLPQANSYADVFKGEITKDGDDKQFFKLAYEDSHVKKELQIWVTTEIKFMGLSTLTEVVNGDEVTVTAQLNTESNRWEADSVEISKVMIRDPIAEAPVPQAIVQEIADRAVEAKAAKPGIDLAATETRLAEMEKAIDTLREKTLHTPMLQEETDMMLADLGKKRIVLKSKIEEFKAGSSDQLEEIAVGMGKAADELQEALLEAEQEIASDKKGDKNPSPSTEVKG